MNPDAATASILRDVFRRRVTSSANEPAAAGSNSAGASAAESAKGYTPKKGEPTPKRKEAEQDLRRPLRAPKTRREAYQHYRARREQERRGRGGQRSAARGGGGGGARGEERHFRPQDHGPVRAYARDVVDSRRSISEFFLYFSLAIIVLLFLPVPELQLAVTYIVWPLMMVGIVTEGIYVGNRIKKDARQHLPGEDGLRGVGMYAAMRQLQIRKLRLPKPRVSVGDTPVPKRG
ncbi:DUF3043 family protein [Haloactinospora alba]|uniref:DUF3043 family protein n=1 Tax=Haloactinospora alba TaxID=405555 RepID=A0A543NJK4_9ACTN|nr:DUF3043 family protein [Haloactinospora alba]